MSEIKRTLEWFKQAMPEPTIEQACVQVGCAYEETSELSHTLGDFPVSREMRRIASIWKRAESVETKELSSEKLDKVQMLDDIVDEIVTRVGIAHTMGFDLEGALAEVNRSNFSKFEGGKAVFDENGKITKGEHYSKPDLKPYI